MAEMREMEIQRGGVIGLPAERERGEVGQEVTMMDRHAMDDRGRPTGAAIKEEGHEVPVWIEGVATTTTGSDPVPDPGLPRLVAMTNTGGAK